MRVAALLAFCGLGLGCEAGRDAGEPIEPAPEIGALCLEAVPTELDFAAEFPNDMKASATAFATCDGSAFNAKLDVLGEGFLTFTRIVATDGTVRPTVDLDLALAEGERLLVVVVYLARTIDDDVASTLELRARQPGAVGIATVALSGQVLSTCAQCDCCDETVAPELLSWTVDGATRIWSDNDTYNYCSPSHYNCSN